MKTKMIRAVECILDWSLWPRFESKGLDPTNIARMCDALRAGFKLPPVIVDKDSKRIIDGFHRIRAFLKVFGDDVEIEAELREYDSEKDMFLDAVRLNAHQGMPLTPKDKAHAFLKARRWKVPIPEIAKILEMPEEKLRQFIEKRTVTTPEGERIAISRQYEGLAGQKLSEEQIRLVRTGGGLLSVQYARMLINALRANAVEFEDEKIISVFTELRDLLNKVLEGVPA